MPDIVTRGTKGAELSFQEGDEQIAQTQLAVTGALTIDENHNREHLVITSGTGAISLGDATALEAALDTTSTGLEPIGWVVKISNNSGSANEINLETSGTDTLNGVVGGTYSLADNDSIIIGFDALSTPEGFNIVGEYIGTLPVVRGGTGRATGSVAYSVICAGTTATGVQQNTAGVGTSGQVLTSNGAGALPTMEDSTSGGSFPATTRMIFQQTAAPIGWTKDTTSVNERALRVVSGTASAGGSVNFTTAFASSRATSSEASHTHSGTTLTAGTITGTSTLGPGGQPAVSNPHTHAITGNTGAGSSHSHTSNLAVLYLDVIIAVKD